MSIPIIQTNQLIFVFLSIWILSEGGHCKTLAPEYEKLAKNMKGIVKVAAVNCDDEKELAGAFGIKGKKNNNIWIIEEPYRKQQ